MTIPPNRTVWDALVALAATALDVPAADVGGPTRGPARAALARQLAYYLAVTTLGWTASDAGRVCGRDRTSVSHALPLIEDRRDCPQFDAMVERLEEAALAAAGLAGAANSVPGLPIAIASRKSRATGVICL
ncbi:hypothetical protein [Acuticoccus yangtzensis]|uniref:hypothetical protein n=1 Tax=Acuticoccus yangtzensis TaxID=1443441 RepID=UPI0009498B82|nr:hypothetical protein [Acuticoccus yangtzensis]